jgi:hypothetical protein
MSAAVRRDRQSGVRLALWARADIVVLDDYSTKRTPRLLDTLRDQLATYPGARAAETLGQGL